MVGDRQMDKGWLAGWVGGWWTGGWMVDSDLVAKI